MPQLRALPPACGVTGTETAQRFLASAYDSVEAVLMTRETLRGIRRTQGGDVRGRLTSPEEDQLRAPIVLTGAGLDATLKQLIRDTLVHLVIQNEQARSRHRPARTRCRRGRLAVWICLGVCSSGILIAALVVF